MVMAGGCTQDFDICNCRCHVSDSVRHIMACCAGKCPHCHQYIRLGCVASHKEKCAPKCGTDVKIAKDNF